MSERYPQDEIIAEVRSIRRGLAARFDFDLGRLYDEAQRWAKESDRATIEPTPKRAQVAS